MSERPTFFIKDNKSLQTEAQKAFDFSQIAKMPETRQNPQSTDKTK
jgi:hypothetical protein